ncbi:MAG: sugar transferase [Candidatus Omnitrophota bacterium]
MSKRIFDIILSAAGLFFTIPLWIIFMLIIWITDGHNPLYIQKRVGKNCKNFLLLKFRTMIAGAERDTGPVFAGKADERITTFGIFLRSTALDELPQLINILKGDMSFVGPRPERPEFVEKYIKDVLDYKKRFSVLPGLTGLAQVYGYYDSSPQEKLRYDLEYIKKQNLWIDLQLIVKSFIITFQRKWGS